VTAAPSSFIGALLIDDVFSDLFHGSSTTLRAIHPDNLYFADFAIDNLAVRSVPEPPTGILFSVAAVVVGMLRRRRSVQPIASK
jgi:hypothetical protein